MVSIFTFIFTFIFQLVEIHCFRTHSCAHTHLLENMNIKLQISTNTVCICVKNVWRIENVKMQSLYNSICLWNKIKNKKKKNMSVRLGTECFSLFL